MISETNKKARLRFATEHIDKPIEFWKSTLWSDEPKFELFGSKRRQNFWREDGGAFKIKHLTPTVKHGGGSIMLWGVFFVKWDWSNSIFSF